MAAAGVRVSALSARESGSSNGGREAVDWQRPRATTRSRAILEQETGLCRQRGMRDTAGATAAAIRHGAGCNETSPAHMPCLLARSLSSLGPPVRPPWPPQPGTTAQARQVQGGAHGRRAVRPCKVRRCLPPVRSSLRLDCQRCLSRAPLRLGRFGD